MQTNVSVQEGWAQRTTVGSRQHRGGSKDRRRTSSRLLGAGQRGSGSNAHRWQGRGLRSAQREQQLNQSHGDIRRCAKRVAACDSKLDGGLITQQAERQSSGGAGNSSALSLAMCSGGDASTHARHAAELCCSCGGRTLALWCAVEQGKLQLVAEVVPAVDVLLP